MSNEAANKLEEWMDLIPLYLNGSLQGGQRQAFEQALKTHPKLEQELALMRDVQSSWENEENQAEFDKLFRRISPALNKQGPVTQNKQATSLINRIATWFAIPQLAWGVALAQFCVIAILVGASLDEKKDIGYRTLTGNGNTQTQVLLNVVFVQDAELQQINALLRAVNARIVDGPSAAGRITLGLIESSSDIQSTEERIAILRESDIVVLAEPWR